MRYRQPRCPLHVSSTVKEVIPFGHCIVPCRRSQCTISHMRASIVITRWGHSIAELPHRLRTWFRSSAVAERVKLNASRPRLSAAGLKRSTPNRSAATVVFPVPGPATTKRRWLGDAAACCCLFVSASGIFLVWCRSARSRCSLEIEEIVEQKVKDARNMRRDHYGGWI